MVHLLQGSHYRTLLKVSDQHSHDIIQKEMNKRLKKQPPTLSDRCQNQHLEYTGERHYYEGALCSGQT
jgi:hypothetical protein